MSGMPCAVLGVEGGGPPPLKFSAFISSVGVLLDPPAVSVWDEELRLSVLLVRLRLPGEVGVEKPEWGLHGSLSLSVISVWYPEWYVSIRGGDHGIQLENI